MTAARSLSPDSHPSRKSGPNSHSLNLLIGPPHHHSFVAVAAYEKSVTGNGPSIDPNLGRSADTDRPLSSSEACHSQARSLHRD